MPSSRPQCPDVKPQGWLQALRKTSTRASSFKKAGLEPLNKAFLCTTSMPPLTFRHHYLSLVVAPWRSSNTSWTSKCSP